jgi:predicted metal-binding membrane protein
LRLADTAWRVLIGVGLYQWMPLKDSCLAQCQTPSAFIHRHGGLRHEPVQSAALGAMHGLYCVGCCWALMILVFVGGIMNLFWIAGIAIFLMVEKTVPTGRWLSRLAGAFLVACGAFLLVRGGS